MSRPGASVLDVELQPIVPAISKCSEGAKTSCSAKVLAAAAEIHPMFRHAARVEKLDVVAQMKEFVRLHRLLDAPLILWLIKGCHVSAARACP